MLSYKYDANAVRWDCISNSLNYQQVYNYLNGLLDQDLSLWKTKAQITSDFKSWIPYTSISESSVKITQIQVGLNTPVPNCILTYVNLITQDTSQIHANTIDLDGLEIIAWSNFNDVNIFIPKIISFSEEDIDE